jgi:ornithine--oxo-acid transaminase
MFGYDKITAMMSGSEAAESAVKIARKWAYTVKGVPAQQAWILTTSHCFHGLTLATMPLSDVIADRMCFTTISPFLSDTMV